MKTLVITPSCKQLFFALMIGVLSFSSCKKETEEEPAMTSEEAEDAMSESVTEDEEGFVAYFEGHASVTAETGSTEAVFNETVTRTGTFLSRLRAQLIFTAETTFKAVNITVDKTTKKIKSGTAQIIMKGTNSVGGAFYYTGTLTFHGNSNGTLVLQNGQSLDIQW